MFLTMLARSLTRRKSRVMTALLAVAMGAAVFQGMMTLSRDVPAQMEREFRSYGANMLLTAAEGETLSLLDAERAVALLPRAKLVGVTPYRYKTVRAHLQPLTAVGAWLDQVKKTSPWWQVDGHWPSSGNEVLAGANVAEFLGLAPGKNLAISGRNATGARFSREVTITGILRTGGAEEDFLFMGLAALDELDGLENPGKAAADIVEVSVACGVDELRLLAEAIRGEVPSVAARLAKRVTSSETSVLDRLRTLVYLVTSVVLVLTMICVATTMMTVVLERRAEIGLKKALGAENSSIAAEFLGEGICLGAAGSLPGIAIGCLFARAIGFSVFGRAIPLNFSFALVTLAVSVALTAAACLFPIRAAVSVEPAIVLKGE
jgi:putative ABC transport system permease protein